jgi:hypothetical protein
VLTPGPGNRHCDEHPVNLGLGAAVNKSRWVFFSFSKHLVSENDLSAKHLTLQTQLAPGGVVCRAVGHRMGGVVHVRQATGPPPGDRRACYNFLEVK